MKDAKGTPSSITKPARTFAMPAKPGGSGSNPGGKHLQGKGDTAHGICGAGKKY